MDVVHEDLFHFFHISFMVVGYTKFGPDRLFSNIATVFNQSDVFNIDQLAELIQKYALATIDDGKIVRTWQCLLSEKYTNLRGIRGFHDFIIVKHPTTGPATMKVRQFCHGGSFENTPMKVTKQDCVLPTPSHSYKFQDQLHALTKQKLKDLRHMYNHYVNPDLWPDFMSQS